MEYYVIERQSISQFFSELEQSGITCYQISLMTGVPISEVKRIKDEKICHDEKSRGLMNLIVNLRMDQNIDLQLLLKQTVHILITFRCMKEETICRYLNISESELNLIVTDYQKASIKSIIGILRLERTLSLINTFNEI